MLGVIRRLLTTWRSRREAATHDTRNRHGAGRLRILGIATLYLHTTQLSGGLFPISGSGHGRTRASDMKPLVSESFHPDHGLASGIGRDSEKYILRGTTVLRWGFARGKNALLYYTIHRGYLS